MGKSRRARAVEYFKNLGIDPNKKPDQPIPMLNAPEVQEGVTTLPCVIEVECFLFYTYLEVDVPDKGKKFEGHSGGVGIPGDIEAAGAIYFADWNVLVGTSTFGVAFVAEDGGVVQVTWGSHGNATAAGVGEATGAFGGSGSWKNM